MFSFIHTYDVLGVYEEYVNTSFCLFKKRTSLYYNYINCLIVVLGCHSDH